MTVEMHDEGARRSIARFGRHLMADALALVQPDTVRLAPGTRDHMKLLFIGRCGRYHMVDKKSETIRLGDPLDTELLFYLLENQIKIAGEIVAQYIVGLDLDLAARRHRRAGRCGASQYLLGNRIAHRHAPASSRLNRLNIAFVSPADKDNRTDGCRLEIGCQRDQTQQRQSPLCFLRKLFFICCLRRESHER